MHVVLPQHLVGARHIADDDGHMLKRQVVTASVGGHWCAGGAEELHQLDAFVPQLQVNHPNVRMANTVELIELWSTALLVAHFLEGEDGGVELDGLVHIGDGDGHWPDLQRTSACWLGLAGERDLEGCDWQPRQTQPAECPATKHCSLPLVPRRSRPDAPECDRPPAAHWP